MAHATGLEELAVKGIELLHRIAAALEHQAVEQVLSELKQRFDVRRFAGVSAEFEHFNDCPVCGLIKQIDERKHQARNKGNKPDGIKP